MSNPKSPAEIIFGIDFLYCFNVFTTCLSMQLRALVGASASSVEAAGEAISLLSQLGVPEEQLRDSLIQAAEATLRSVERSL